MSGIAGGDLFRKRWKERNWGGRTADRGVVNREGQRNGEFPKTSNMKQRALGGKKEENRRQRLMGESFTHKEDRIGHYTGDLGGRGG